MALIAPGAFLWTTFQIQASQKARARPHGPDMWTGLFFALVLALLTAYSYSELARIYPDAGTGSSYYFAEAALLDKESPEHQARAPGWPSSPIGWISHLYYWLYPAIMVGVHRDPVRLHLHDGVPPHPDLHPAGGRRRGVGASSVGYIAYRGISGSTMAAIVINVIQITCLTLVSILFIAYRIGHRRMRSTSLANAGRGGDPAQAHQRASTSRPSPSCCWSASSR